MARPIETTDEHLLAAADKVLMTEGPSAFTLAKAAECAAVSAATFIKRFGSKQELFLRLSQRWFDSLDGFLHDTAAAQASPLARLRTVALANYHDLDNPATVSNQLAALAVDLQDDKMRELLDSGWRVVRRHLEQHAADAVSIGELAGCPPPEQLARIVFVAMEGGCLSWSVRPEGSLVARLGDDLDALLHSWTGHRKEITT